MWVSGQQEVNEHVFTYVKGENLEEEVLASITSYESGTWLLSEEIDYNIAENIERSRYGKNLEDDIETYPLDQDRVKDIALGVRNNEIPLGDEEVKKMLGEMTDSEKARKKMDFFY